MYFQSILFADDGNLFYSHLDIKELYETVNHEMTRNSSWFKANRLSLNIKKTNYKLFTTDQYPELPSVLIGNIEIIRSDCVKFLGLYVDEKLSWKKQIHNISSTVSRNIGVIRKLRSLFPQDILFKLYNTLTNGLLAWGNCGVGLMNRLTKLQKEPLE